MTNFVVPAKMEENLDFTKAMPLHIADLIFRHLDLAALKEMTQVSPDWNDVIEGSRACMDKMKIRFQCPIPRLNNNEPGDLTPEDEEKLLQCRRRYRHVLVAYIKIGPSLEEFFKKNQNHWKSVLFAECSFATPEGS